MNEAALIQEAASFHERKYRWDDLFAGFEPFINKARQSGRE